MRRRELIAQIAGIAATWPVAVRSQQPEMPVVGFLEGGSAKTSSQVAHAVNQGLADMGYVEGRNIVIEYRWADDHYDRLADLAADLVHRQVSVIVTSTTPAALAAKAATKSIPIVFSMGSDPVALGLVDSLSRPQGNTTGVVALIRATSAKRLELMHELVPEAGSFGFLVNPTNPFFAEPETRDLQAAAEALRVRLLIVNAKDPSEFEPAFAALARQDVGGLIPGSDTLFFNRPVELVELADRYRIPTIYYRNEAMAAGGLMSYGTDLPETWRQAGRYAGRVLNGEKPANLPVQQAVKMRLAVNPKTARRLGLHFPATLLARADEVIE
jgi:putative ABC transport system substrate-binding protein